VVLISSMSPQSSAVVCPPLPKAARAPENIDRAAASETVRAIHADVLRFGMDRVFPPEERGGAD